MQFCRNRVVIREGDQLLHRRRSFTGCTCLRAGERGRGTSRLVSRLAFLDYFCAKRKQSFSWLRATAAERMPFVVVNITFHLYQRFTPTVFRRGCDGKLHAPVFSESSARLAERNIVLSKCSPLGNRGFGSTVGAKQPWVAPLQRCCSRSSVPATMVLASRSFVIRSSQWALETCLHGGCFFLF